MPRTKEQFAEMKDERRESIFAAALPLFSLNKKVTIDDICEKAKCSHGIVYHYFKNTDQVLEKLMQRPTIVELKNSLLNITKGSSYEKIEEILSIMLDISPKNVVKICYLNLLIKSREKDSVFALLSKLVSDGQKAHTISGGVPEEIVEAIFSLLRGIYLPFLLEKHPDIKVPSVETVMQLIRKPTTFSHQIL